jgi:hypothetical protein
MEENREQIEIPEPSKELISSKIRLLKNNLQPIISKVRTETAKDGWDKYRMKLYIQVPWSKSIQTVLNNKVITGVSLILGAILAAKFATPIEDFTTFLLGKIKQWNNPIVNELITDNGQDKLDEKVKSYATTAISAFPVTALIYIGLHLWHVTIARKDMLDYKNASFNLGLYKIHNPEIVQLAEAFGKDGFELEQFESFIRSEDDSEKQKKTIEMITDLQVELKTFQLDVENLTNDAKVLNELFDAFQRNFNRLSNVILHNDFVNFELSLSLLSKKFVLYRFEKGKRFTKKIIDSGEVGTDRLLEINANKHQPFIDLYIKDKNWSEGHKCVSYLCRMNEEETWVITYYLDTDTQQRMKFLVEDGKIGVEEEESIFSSHDVYEIIRKHLLVIHHIDSMLKSLKEE